MKNYESKDQKLVKSDDLNELLNETKETIAEDMALETGKNKPTHFSVADMWNIQKKTRYSYNMSRWLN